MLKRVAILGAAPSIAECPFDDEGLEVWLIGSVLGNPKATPDLLRADTIFEVHPRPDYVSRIEAMNRFGCRVYLQHEDPAIPRGEVYPREEILARFRRLFSSTVDHMLALAIYQEFERIELYGVHMASDEEYAHQKPDTQYWLGYAEGKGIEISITEESDLLKSEYDYGYEAPPLWWTELGKWAENARARKAAIETERQYLRGVEDTSKHIRNLLARGA